MEQAIKSVRLNVSVPDALRLEVHLRAVGRRQNMGQYVIRALENQFRIEDGTAVVPDALGRTDGYLETDTETESKHA